MAWKWHGYDEHMIRRRHAPPQSVRPRSTPSAPSPNLLTTHSTALSPNSTVASNASGAHHGNSPVSGSGQRSIFTSSGCSEEGESGVREDLDCSLLNFHAFAAFRHAATRFLTSAAVNSGRMSEYTVRARISRVRGHMSGEYLRPRRRFSGRLKASRVGW
jgi:hypothetical protein